MIEKHLDIATADGAMNTFVVYPEEDGPFPVVLFYMDAPGKREELHDMARRLAAVGYYVALPNLYYRSSRDFWLKERNETTMAYMFGLMATLTAKTNHCDTQAMLKFIDSQPEAMSARIGAVGYCMSGPFVMWAAAEFLDRFQCIASIHGANMVTDQTDSPHLMPPKIQCESYFACAEIDKWAPPEDIATLQKALVAAGSVHRIEWFPAAEHGFVFPLRAGIYRQADAERHWERLFSLFKRNLSSSLITR
jgi:carboxymethylenebutenolidase